LRITKIIHILGKVQGNRWKFKPNKRKKTQQINRNVSGDRKENKTECGNKEKKTGQSCRPGPANLPTADARNTSSVYIQIMPVRVWLSIKAARRLKKYAYDRSATSKT